MPSPSIESTLYIITCFKNWKILTVQRNEPRNYDAYPQRPCFFKLTLLGALYMNIVNINVHRYHNWRPLSVTQSVKVASPAPHPPSPAAVPPVARLGWTRHTARHWWIFSSSQCLWSLKLKRNTKSRLRSQRTLQCLWSIWRQYNTDLISWYPPVSPLWRLYFTRDRRILTTFV